ncbi:MAG: hypothetical protein ACR2O6_03795 [Ilumatobacteraceae bacterium]
MGRPPFPTGAVFGPEFRLRLDVQAPDDARTACGERSLAVGGYAAGHDVARWCPPEVLLVKLLRSALGAFAVAVAIAAILRVRGTGGTPPQHGGWRPLDLPDR